MTVCSRGNDPVGQLIDLGERWLRRTVNANTARPRRTHLGINALRSGQVAGAPYWLPWCLERQVNPLDCGGVFAALEDWGHDLERRTQVRSEPMSTNYALNLWNTARAWHRWLASPRGAGWDCTTDELYAELPRWQFLSPTPVRPKSALPVHELGALVQAADTVGSSAEVRCRNGALMALLVATGARGSEVRGMPREHLDLTAARPAVRYQGKRGRWRTAALPTWCAARVRAYLELRDAGLHRPLLGPEPVLAPVGLRVEWQPLAGSTFRDCVDAVVRRAVDTRITAHGVRASLITGALARGYSVWDVASWSGHTDAESLRAYDLRRQADTIAAELHGAVQHALGAA